MNGQTMQSMDEYVTQFEAIKTRVGDEQVAAVILEQIAKDARTERIAAMRNGNGSNGWSGNGSNGWNHSNGDSHGDEQPATQKQLEYLRDLGVKVPKKVSKQEASRLIDEAMASR